MEATNFATGQDQPPNGIGIARSAFQPVRKVDCAQFVFVGSFQSVLARRDKRDLIGRARQKGADGRLYRDQRGRVQPSGSISNRCDALSINKKDGVLIAVVMARLGCTRTEINRWASAGGLLADGQHHVCVNKSVQDRAWRKATVDYAATMIEKWREQDARRKPRTGEKLMMRGDRNGSS